MERWDEQPPQVSAVSLTYNRAPGEKEPQPVGGPAQRFQEIGPEKNPPGWGDLQATASDPKHVPLREGSSL